MPAAGKLMEGVEEIPTRSVSARTRAAPYRLRFTGRARGAGYKLITPRRRPAPP
jgi:hypothetical protein